LGPVPPFDPRHPPDDPWPALAQLRAAGPLARFPDAGLSVACRYRDVRDAFARPDLFSSRYNVKPDGDYSIVSTDPPEHTRQRRILNRAFTPAKVAALEPRIREIAEGLVDGFPTTGPVDVVASFAFLLPVTVLAELLGVPHADRAQFKVWSDEQLSQSLAAGTSPTAQEFKQWALDQVLRRRRSASPPDDLITALACTEVDGERLGDWEAASTLVLLVVAGHETTKNALATAIRFVAEDAGLRDRLAADRALIPAFVEESLRLDPPVTALPRKTRCPTAIGDEKLDEDEIVLLHMGAANRDAAFVDDPDVMRLDRRLPAPHLAFGFGIHLCIGAPLARTELRIGIETLLDRRPGLRAVAGQTIEQTPAYVFRGPTTLLLESS
jgi:cytochrome P450